MLRTVSVTALWVVLASFASLTHAVTAGSVVAVATIAKQQSTREVAISQSFPVANASLEAPSPLEAVPTLIAFRPTDDRAARMAALPSTAARPSNEDADSNWLIMLTGVVLVVLVTSRRSRRF